MEPCARRFTSLVALACLVFHSQARSTMLIAIRLDAHCVETAFSSQYIWHAFGGMECLCTFSSNFSSVKRNEDFAKVALCCNADAHIC